MGDGELLQQKRRQIIDCVEGDCNVKLLREYSVTLYGLVDNDVRSRVWPLIVGASADILPIFDEDHLKAHPSYHQVELDVNRLDSLLPADSSPEEKFEIKATMMRLVISVLLDNPTAHYYQGFHDICYIFLSVLGETSAREVLNRILPTRLNLFMEPSMESTVDYMQLIFVLLARLRPTLAGNLEAVGLGPHFALAWIVTWFAHVLPEMDDVRRLFDLFLATDPIMLIYLSVAVIIQSDDEVQSTTADFGLLHQTLLRLPKKHPVEELVRHSVKLCIRIPPHELMELAKQRQAMSHSSHEVGIRRPSNLIKCAHEFKWFLGAFLVASFACLVYWWRAS